MQTAAPAVAAQTTRLFVGNFPYRVKEHDLIQLFAPYGELSKAPEIMHRRGLSRGFGFVEMDREGAKRAIKDLHGTVIDDRKLEVTEARPREQR